MESLPLQNENASQLDPDETLKKLERWDKELEAHWGDWLKEARRSFDLVAGYQWTEEDIVRLKGQDKIPVTFNRVGPVLDAVCGAEILGRQEVKYYPRTLGDTGVNEVITRGAEWVRDQCDASGEESDAARDCFICGLGYTETRMDFEEKPKGQIIIECGPAMKCLPDPNARKSNAVDARYLRYRNEMTKDEFDEAYPDHETARNTAQEQAKKISSDPRQEYEAGRTRAQDLIDVDLWQWYEVESYVVAPSQDGLRTVEYPLDVFKDLQAAADEAGVGPIPHQQLKRRKYYEAILCGGEFLQAPRPLRHQQFRFKFKTGKRDKTHGVWYGLVRPMTDPQMWANEFVSMILHILRKNAKGGLAVERGAEGGNGENPAHDQKQFEESWAKSDEITWVGEGALSGNRILPKTAPPLPASIGFLFEQSITAIRDASGVSQEMMGLVEHNQPGILEHQRKQAGFAILASFFDSFRRYRKFQGELLLKMMKDLPEDTLVRVVGEDGNPQYVHLAMQDDTQEYDCIVGDAPSGPNQKERNWGMFMQVLPVVKDMMNPELWLEILRYSPFPEAMVNKIREVLSKGPEDQKTAMMENLRMMMTQMQGQKMQADIRKTNADAQATEVKTQITAMRPDPMPQVAA